VRGVARPIGGVTGLTLIGFTVKGVRGRGEIDSNRVAGMRRRSDRVGMKKFGHREVGLAEQVARSAGAVVVANNFNTHRFFGLRIESRIRMRNRGCTRINTD
jgi:hypothetical protein